MRGALLFLVVFLSTALARGDDDTRQRKNELWGSASGILPVGIGGGSINLGLESGSLVHWQATGDAFEGQPVRLDVVRRRRGDMSSGHHGQYWIGTFEIGGDGPQGTLTSESFAVTQPFASFLVGGGKHPTTAVEIVREDTGEVILRASGEDRENMRPVTVDLTGHLGKKIFVRLVDLHSGPWGHINFDRFSFHSKRPVLALQSKNPDRDFYTHAGLSPEDAVRVMTLPEGFEATLFAGEPDVRQPIAFTIDDRGRLWVAEAYEYPFRAPKGKGRDRILIFEDTDGDGKFDHRKIFIEKLNLVSGLELGFGGVWVGAAPYLLFIPDKDGDDEPDGPPKVLLDGWAYQDTHETLNTFIWGPDGWLYGCHGVFTHSNVGKPGTPDDQRIPINAGIWRYHPTKQVFEVFAYGTSNPWGLDFNDYGQSILTTCVIPHLFHVIQGARYHRQAGPHFQPYTFEDIKTIARHRHWIGRTPHSGNDFSDAAGGGHAHAGAMIYLGGSWPEEYRNRIFMNNIHGARINQDRLMPNGSGYAGDRAADFLMANDRWSQILNLRYGPDGQVYLIDWYDNNQCHLREEEIHDRSNGRIFKISYENAKPVEVDLKKLGDLELVEMQLHQNDWYVRHARRILQERAHQNGPNPAVHQALEEFAFTHPDVTRRLRGLWALHVTGGLTESLRAKGLQNDNEHVRAWSIQLIMEEERDSASYPSSPIISDAVKDFVLMAKSDPSQVVRLYLASALQRLPLEKRWPILEGLLGHGEDAQDHNLPLMYWYAAEPLAEVDMSRALELASNSKIPLVLSFMVRRIGSIGTPETLALLVERLGSEETSERQLMIIHGLGEALKGRRRVPMPAGWQTVSQKLERSPIVGVRSAAQALAVTFGDPRALDRMRHVLLDADAGPSLRKNALASLLGAKDAELAPLLQTLLGDPVINGPVLRGLAAYDNPKTPRKILAVYPSLSLAKKRDALNTLASRESYAEALLDAMAIHRVPPTDVSAEIARQIRNLGNETITRRLGRLWGVVRQTSADKAELITKYKNMLATRPRLSPDLALGRAIFNKTCQQCHKLFGAGGKIGPELTGSNRGNLDYMLSNILDPSAVMAKEYQPSIIASTDGRILTGIVEEKTSRAMTIVTANETLTLPIGEIESMRLSEKSMMPDDLWAPLGQREVRSLLAYLASPSQVPMLATPETLKSFYNGIDLAGWDGNSSLWNVEDGEIVGRTDGLKKNEFLRSQLTIADFEFTVEVKLKGNRGNSGIQFRSQALPNGLVKGYQADIGVGWWGKLYEEHGRKLLWKKSGEEFVVPGGWNTYKIVALGDKIRTYINGHPCVRLDDPKGAKRGIIAFQLHSGGPTEVRFRNLELKLDPKRVLPNR